MRLSQLSSSSLSLAQLRVSSRAAQWRVRIFLQHLFLRRQRLLRMLVFGITLFVGAGVLGWALFITPPDAGEVAPSDWQLAVGVIDQLEFWLEERDRTRGADIPGLTASLFKL